MLIPCRRQTSPVWRCRIVLLTADGLGTNAIMREAGVAKTPPEQLTCFMDLIAGEHCRLPVLFSVEPLGHHSPLRAASQLESARGEDDASLFQGSS